MEQGEVEKLQLCLDALKHGVNNNDDDNKREIKGRGAAVVEETMTERQVQVRHHQELHNKKWKILIEDYIFFEGIPQMFLQPIPKISKLEKEKEKFQTYLKE